MADVKRLEFDVTVSRPAWNGHFSADLDTDLVGLVGPSGGGKSTLIRVFAGVAQAKGRLSVNGQEWQSPQGLLKSSERGVGWAPQSGTLFPHMTVEENIRASGQTNVDVDSLVEVLRIAHLLDRMPRLLSGGERRRVAIARAVCAARRALILDEPFASLNSEMAQEVANYIAGFAKDSEVLLLVADHREDLVETLAEAVLRIEDGQISEVASL